MSEKCVVCSKQYSVDCDYQQGRCPLHPPVLTSYHFRYLNLWNLIKKALKRG
jgi:hypothetical protein